MKEPSPEHCSCGHLVRTYVKGAPDELDKALGLTVSWHVKADVVKRPCPHDNGTVIEYCPKCDRQVGLWGAGLATTMECACWQ